MGFTIPARPGVAPALQELAAALAAAGHPAWLAGEELAACWWSPAPPGPRCHRMLTSASPAALLELFPRAVVTGPFTLSLASAAGPIDCIAGRELPGALAELGFRIHAVGWDAVEQALVDPFDGLGDARAARLRTAGDAAALLEEFPLLALRALRLVAELDLEPDASLVSALGAAPVSPPPHAALRSRGRAELVRMLCGPHAGRALELAAESGLAKNLAPEADPGVARWIDALPVRAELRLAVWLGRGAGPWLRDWRFGLDRSPRVLELAEHHPIDEAAVPRRDASVSRLLRRLGPEDRADLVTARRAQLASGALPPEAERRSRAALEALSAAVERVARNRMRAAARAQLAISGAQVMEQLGCGPGPQVGRALRQLADLVAAEPARNTEAELRAALQEWATTL
jgi:tRNA nucleotidyltransferase/poly(A) polymerase